LIGDSGSRIHLRITHKLITHKLMAVWGLWQGSAICQSFGLRVDQAGRVGWALPTPRGIGEGRLSHQLLAFKGSESGITGLVAQGFFDAEQLIIFR